MRLSDLTQNISLKLFSLLVGVVLYVLVNAESTTPVDVDFPVEYELPDGIVITGTPLGRVSVTLQGPWANLRSFDSEALPPVKIDLRGAGPGSVRHHVDLAHVRAPGGMRVVAVRPSEIDLTLDRLVEKQVPVQVDTVGKPAFGFEVVEVRADPARVRVEGPQSAMRALEFVYTRSVDVSEREDDLRIEVDVRPPGPPVRVQTKAVKVFVDIGEEIIERTFRDLPVVVENAPKRTKVTPQKITVTVKGPRRLVEALDASTLQAAVDALPEAETTDASVIQKGVAVKPELPERVQVVGSNTKVELQLPKRTTGKKTRR